MPGPPFDGILVTGGDVDDVQREIGEFRREGCRQVVATQLDQNQIERGKLLLHLRNGGEIDRGVLADGGVRAAAGLDAGDALGGKRAGAHEIFGVPFGVDVIGDRRDLVALA